MTTPSIRSWVRNAAAVFSRTYGAVTHQAELVGCSRQALYQQARRIEQRLQSIDGARPAPPHEVVAPPATIDHGTRVRFAVIAYALGISTRQIEALLGVLAPDDGPDHSTVGRWVSDHAMKATAILAVLDPACAPHVTVACLDEVFLGGNRPW